MDEQNHQQNDPNRRRFLRTLMWGSVILAAAEGGLASLLYVWPRRSTGFGGRVVAGNLTDFPIGSVTKITEGRFYLARLPDGLIALHWRCTHLGCTVPWVAGVEHFQCPCHGSLFDNTGQNLSGPAPRPLDYMEVEVHDGQVIVDTARVHQRKTHLPEHVTPV